jgi:hypothetical protein
MPFQAYIIKRSSFEEGPEGQGGPHERLEESSTCEMGMQVSCGDIAEVSKKGFIRQTATGDRIDITGVVPLQGYRAGRG